MKADVAIIGAGMAGCVCASTLDQRGFAVVVMEKSGDIGGRLATRRRPDGHWNHGAPGLIPRSARFQRFLTSLEAAGSAERDDGPAAERRYGGLPDMRELLRPLAADLPILLNARAIRLSRGRAGWIVHTETLDYGPFRAVVIAIPAPQAAELLSRSCLDNFVAPSSVSMTPVWSLMLGFEKPRLPPANVDRRIIQRMIPQAPRPEISTGWLPERWVVHATAEWSRAQVDLDHTDAAARLLAAVDPALAGRNANGADVVMAHRWRFALAPSPLGRTHLWDPQNALGLAGDWCLGSTAEDAFASGAALALDVSRSLLASNARATIHA